MTIEQLQSLLARVGEVKRTIGRMAVEVVENDGDDDIAVALQIKVQAELTGVVELIKFRMEYPIK